MGKKIRPRPRLQRSAAARSRAAARVLGGRKPQRRSARRKIQRTIAAARRGDFGAREALIDLVLR